MEAPMTQHIFPALRYRDAPAAIEWLERAFGFERLAVHPAPDGTVAHAELVLDGGVVMLGSVKPDAFGGRSPREVGEISQSLYVWVSDVDAHHARAAAAGAEVFRGPEDTFYGSREYSCRDPEGHVWSFGTYRPETRA
jgi:uncharacterized glyoxalase superfamily protein PhnB